MVQEDKYIDKMKQNKNIVRQKVKKILAHIR